MVWSQDSVARQLRESGKEMPEIYRVDGGTKKIVLE